MAKISIKDIIWKPKTFNSAKAFLDCLRLTNSHWSGPHESWIFRGQRDAKWGLMPKAFRGWDRAFVS